MKKLPPDDLLILGTSEWSADIKTRLLQFNRAYQVRVLKYFAELRLIGSSLYPDDPYPGMFAEVDSISGKIRPLSEQKVWSWGDCRALGIWSYFLCKNVIPDAAFNLWGQKHNLFDFYDDYCNFIYENLLERYKLNGEYIPFIVEQHTNKASDDPRNHPPDNGEYDPTIVFAASAFMQYGIWKDNNESLELGLKLLDDALDCGFNYRNVSHLTGKRESLRSHGFLMITAGAIVDTLKCIRHNQAKYMHYNPLYDKLIPEARKIAELIFKNYCDRHTGEFWEYNTEKDKAYINPEGHMICDPGHTAEACGFFAELCDFINDGEEDKMDHLWSRKEMLKVLVKIMMKINKNGYSPKGVMYKNIDIIVEEGIPDTITADGTKYKTAPWWNLREHAAASIKLCQLTRYNYCYLAFIKARNSSYLHYPNADIGGLMVQTLNAETLEPLPFHPATGNLDPMHDPRAREREIEALDLIN